MRISTAFHIYFVLQSTIFPYRIPRGYKYAFNLKLAFEYGKAPSGNFTGNLKHLTYTKLNINYGSQTTHEYLTSCLDFILDYH